MLADQGVSEPAPRRRAAGRSRRSAHGLAIGALLLQAVAGPPPSALAQSAPGQSAPQTKGNSKHDPRRAAVLAGPDVRATRTVTSFASALACMDGLLLQYGKHDITVISNGVPDATDTLHLGTRDMVISALDTMSLRSGAFKYIDADQSDADVMHMQQAAGGTMKTADYYIKGTISQVDQGVLSSGKKAGAALNFLSFGRSQDLQVTDVSVDLSMFHVSDRTLISGVRAQNTMQIVRSGSSTDLGGLLKFASVLYEVHEDRAQGSHQTVRTLIELSLIELMGKFTKVPYWRCLALPDADPKAREVALEYYSRMNPSQQIIATETALGGHDYYHGAKDGIMSPELGEAIARYRVENGLGAGPHVDFELYFSFLAKGWVADGDAGDKRHAPVFAPAAADDTLQFDMDVPSTVAQGDALTITLRPNRNAYFYCFMAGGTPSEVYRIYPNQFTGEQPMTPRGSSLVIPGDGHQVAIRLNDPGKERVACIGRESPYTRMPRSMTMRDFVVFKYNGHLPALDLVVNEHQGFDPTGLHSSVRFRDIVVASRRAEP